MLANEAKERQGARNDIVELIPPSSQGKARDKARELFQVSGHYIDEAEKIKKESPADFEAILTPKKTITETKRDIRERKREQHRNENAQKVADVKVATDETAAVFSTIVIDPPWDWGRCFQTAMVRTDYVSLRIFRWQSFRYKTRLAVCLPNRFTLPGFR